MPKKGERQVAVPGIVLQELLSGISEPALHARVLAGVRESFPVVLATEGDHLAAQALNRRASLLTSDEDFQGLTRIGTLKLL